jgi:hypothetical protein
VTSITTPKVENIVPGTNPEPVPVNGYDAYNEYIYENRKISTPEVDYVLIEFIVKDDSKITNLKVLEETQEDLGKEAIRLIKEGPNWFPAIQEGVAVKKRVELKIEF